MPNSAIEYDVLMTYKLKYEMHPFLQAIADADPDSAKELLEDNPQLAVMACGTVTTSSGNTYENVTAIQLAYLMDDVDMCNMMLPYINKLPKEMIEKANDQLAKKMAEVEVQQSQFKPFDFNPLVQAITVDQVLIDTFIYTGRPNAETEKELVKLKEYFKAGTIKLGKSFIKEHLQEGFSIYDQNCDSWNRNQLLWFFINVIGHIETLAEKCFEQECSQGLREIVDEKKPNQRANTIKNYFNNLPLTYRGSHDSSLLLGRNFFVEIYYGGRSADIRSVAGMDASRRCLKIYIEQKNQAWKNLSSSLTSNNRHTNSSRY